MPLDMREFLESPGPLSSKQCNSNAEYMEMVSKRVEFRTRR